MGVHERPASRIYENQIRPLARLHRPSRTGGLPREWFGDFGVGDADAVPPPHSSTAVGAGASSAPRPTRWHYNLHIPHALSGPRARASSLGRSRVGGYPFRGPGTSLVSVADFGLSPPTDNPRLSLQGRALVQEGSRSLFQATIPTYTLGNVYAGCLTTPDPNRPRTCTGTSTRAPCGWRHHPPPRPLGLRDRPPQRHGRAEDGPAETIEAATRGRAGGAKRRFLAYLGREVSPPSTGSEAGTGGIGRDDERRSTSRGSSASGIPRRARPILYYRVEVGPAF